MTIVNGALAPDRRPSPEEIKEAVLAWLANNDHGTPDDLPRLVVLALDDVVPARDPLSAPRGVRIDEFGVLWRDGTWVALTPVEERLMRELLDNLGRVCGRTALVRAGWPHGLRNARVVDTYVRRLRSKIPLVGLEIRTVRQRGYLLHAVD